MTRTYLASRDWAKSHTLQERESSVETQVVHSGLRLFESGQGDWAAERQARLCRRGIEKMELRNCIAIRRAVFGALAPRHAQQPTMVQTLQQMTADSSPQPGLTSIETRLCCFPKFAHDSISNGYYWAKIDISRGR